MLKTRFAHRARMQSWVWLAASLIGWLAATSALAEDRENEPKFSVKPAVDGALILGLAVVTATTEAIITTGELDAQLPNDTADLLGIDAWSTRRASTKLRGSQTSDLGVYLMGAWVVADIALAAAGARADSALTYGAIYAETALTTWFICNVFKMAVRRPRPRAYIELRENGYVSEATQDSLSFYSLHTALTAALGATATYFAFARNEPQWVRWVILGGSIIATGIVGGGRLYSGAHFTTDVLTGLGAGLAVGVLIPEIHRRSPVQVLPSVDGRGLALQWAGTF